MTKLVARLIDRDTNRPGRGPVVYLIEESGGRLWIRKDTDPPAAAGETISIPATCDCRTGELNFEVVSP